MTPRETGTEKLLVEVDDGIARLTFNDPAKRNALSSEVRAALPGALRDLQADGEVRVVVVTGSGRMAFVSGADISEFAEQRTSAAARAAYDAMAADAAQAWDDLEKPVIAMIRGFCIGGGLLVALQADIRVASDDSQLGIPASRMGLGFGYGAVLALVALVGPAHAAEMVFSARRLPADEALHIGLVNRVVPAAALEEQVAALAVSIRDNAPLTVQAAKAAIRQAARAGQPAETDRVVALIEACFRSDDYREGQAAFLEKRPPRFRGG